MRHAQPSWAVFGGPVVGTGPTNLTLRILFPNTTAQPVNWDTTIGGLPLAITQDPPTCRLTVTPPEVRLSVNGGSGSVAVTGVGTDCSFAPFFDTPESWTNITPLSGVAPATLTYNVGMNPSLFERSDTVSYLTASFRIVQNGTPVSANRFRLAFGGVLSGATLNPFTPSQELAIAIAEQPQASWTATVDKSWLRVTPASGNGAAVLTLSVDPLAAAALPLGLNAAKLSLSTGFAPGSVREVPVDLNLYAETGTTGPRGQLDSPASGLTGLSGAVPITGWALDDIAVQRVRIYRDPVGAEPANAEIFVGDAVQVAGARPDVEGFLSHMPRAHIAGWGLMLLSNVLPNNGNGSFRFSAYAEDVDGHTALMGRTTVNFNNAGSPLPFGTIDAPAQGATVSGTLTNFGWVLTPAGKSVPIDGSTIKLYIDGVQVPVAASYNHPRPDVKAYFPGLANSDGPEAHFTIDTTQFADGVHTIAWGVIDSAGVPVGIGSRYFTIQNAGSAEMAAASQMVASAEASRPTADVTSMAPLRTDVWSRTGVDEDAWVSRIDASRDGGRTIRAAQGERIEVFLDPRGQVSCGTYSGNLIAGDVAGPLPAGTSLDAPSGAFRWQPPVEFVGLYQFVFVQRGCDGKDRRVLLQVLIR